jgi:hypothetical protein
MRDVVANTIRLKGAVCCACPHPLEMGQIVPGVPCAQSGPGTRRGALESVHSHQEGDSAVCSPRYGRVVFSDFSIDMPIELRLFLVSY